MLIDCNKQGTHTTVLNSYDTGMFTNISVIFKFRKSGHTGMKDHGLENYIVSVFR